MPRLAAAGEKAQNDLHEADGFIYTPTSPSSWIKRYNHEKERDPDAYRAAQERLSEVTKERYAAYNHIIAETIQLYHLVPDVTQAAENSNVPTAQPIRSWAPHLSENETYDSQGHGRRLSPIEIKDLWRQYGQVVTDDKAPSPITAGTSSDDSRIVVYPGAFTTPDELALAIYHETVHWLDHVALGRRESRAEHFQSEDVAYQAVLDAHTTFNLTAAQVAQMTAVQERYRHQASALINGYLGDETNWAPSTAINVPAGSVPESDSGLDDIHAIVEEKTRQAREITEKQARDARIEEKAAECRVIDANITDLLIGIVTKACNAPDDFTSDDVSELNDLPENRSYTCDPNFPHTYYPLSQLNDNCQRPLFDNLWNRMTQRAWFSAPTVLSVLRNREGFPPELHAAPTPPIPAAAAVPDHTEADRRRVISFLDDQVRTMQDIAKSVCAGNGALTPTNRIRYLTAYDYLERDYHPYKDGHDPIMIIPGYEPRTALHGLGGCEYSVLLAYILTSYSDIESLNHSGLAAYRHYHPAPTPYRSAPRPERRSPSPRQGDPCRDNGNIRCP